MYGFGSECLCIYVLVGCVCIYVLGLNACVVLASESICFGSKSLYGLIWMRDYLCKLYIKIVNEK
jgi:hypothetical protein